MKLNSTTAKAAAKTGLARRRSSIKGCLRLNSMATRATKDTPAITKHVWMKALSQPSRLPRLRARSRLTRNDTRAIKPGASSMRLTFSRPCGRIRYTIKMPIKPGTRLMWKTMRQCMYSVRYPPSTGPMTRPQAPPRAKRPTASPRRCGGKAWVTNIIVIGSTGPPPIPCRIRQTINEEPFHARPQSTEPTTKSTMLNSRRLRFPSTLPSQPTVGMTTALAIM